MTCQTLAKLGLLCTLCVPVLAQTGEWTEIGVRGGYGEYGTGASSTSRGAAGVDLCAWCGGRYALFGEYTRFIGSAGGGIRSADVLAGGARFQWRERVRPFFDAGIVFARDHYGPQGVFSHWDGGLTLAGGVTIPIGSKAFFRPQFRGYGLRDHGAVFLGVTFGWRF